MPCTPFFVRSLPDSVLYNTPGASSPFVTIFRSLLYNLKECKRTWLNNNRKKYNPNDDLINNLDLFGKILFYLLNKFTVTN